MQKRERATYYLYQLSEAIVKAHTANYPEGPAIQDPKAIHDRLKTAQGTIFAEEGFSGSRSNTLFPHQLGEVLDEFTRNLRNGKRNEKLPITPLDVWVAEENLKDLPHDPEGFAKRQDTLKQLLVVTPRVLPSS